MIQVIAHDNEGKILSVVTGTPDTMAGHLDNTSSIWIERSSIIDPSRFRVNIAMGELEPLPEQEVTAPDLEVMRKAVLKQIDVQAEKVRLAYITAGSGQALEYQATEDEARRYVESGGDPSSYPLLNAELLARQETGESSLTMSDVASGCIALASTWRTAAAEIKRLRRLHKILATQAANIEDLMAATAINWPVPA